jgi:membrane protease YdiL (CAAX protease family)
MAILRRNPVTSFFLIALGLAWLGWIPYGAYRAGLLPCEVPAEVPMFSQYGPFVAALFMSAVMSGAAGVRDLLRRMLHWRVGAGWWLFVLFVPLLAGCGIWVAHLYLGWSEPDFSRLHEWWVKRADSMHYGGWNVVNPTPVPSIGLISWLAEVTASGPFAAVLVWIAMACANGGISEEPGWRGFMQPQLQNTMTALCAALMTGTFWSLWHFGPDSWMLLFKGDFFAFVLPAGAACEQIPLAIIFAALYNNTRSLLLCIVFHAAVNSTYSFGQIIWPSDPFFIRFAEYGLVYWLLAGIIVLIFGPKHLASRAPAPA